MNNKIIIRGAREHNLKNINVDLPRDKFIVITGLSGSGKSSLAFDTIYAEGQRRYVESLSAYARQFLGLMEKPDVDLIDGLSPAISIEQKTGSKNPRSTVGTTTEIYDYLRLLFARIGKPYCYKCGEPISSQTVQQMTDIILSWKKGIKFQILSPIVRGRKGEYKKLLSDLLKKGFTRVRINGNFFLLEDEIKLDKNKKHTIEIVVDRLKISKEIHHRLTESIETALELSNGILLVLREDGKEFMFSEKLACLKCNISYEEIEPRLFSFNSPYGACPYCSGLGTKLEIDPELVIPNKNLSINDGALAAVTSQGGYYYQMIEALAKHYKFSLDTPFKDLPDDIQKIILYGSEEKIHSFIFSTRSMKIEKIFSNFEGIINNLMRRYKQTDSDAVREWIETFMINTVCPYCNGQRLKPEALAIKIKGINIAELSSMPIKNILNFFNNLVLSETEQIISKQIIKEIKLRLKFLINVGLDYLTLDRKSSTLSGGEAQRIKLASQIGSQLMGVIYILDEPSIGLHQRDNHKLIETLLHLRDIGNTIIVVEHDLDTIKASDFVVDLGPGAGRNGGEIVVTGSPKEIQKNKKSITGAYLSGKKKIEIPKKRRPINKQENIKLYGATGNNLKSIDVEFPLGTFICITGVSGSGKSTLINETLYPAISKQLHSYSTLRALPFKKIEGTEFINKIINIDQSPIGRTPRSNPATYTGVFTFIRELFSKLPESRIRGYKPGRFSFNVKGGRCENCSGDGVIKIEMNFLPDVYVTCETCKGKRYNRETLEIKYNGKTIADILDMTVDEALVFFKNIPQINNKLTTLKEVGLGYIHLGQQATTLSGGEAQRIKLATELSKKATGKTLYILDEPTTGLHLEDIQYLLKVLNKLVDKGNTVIVIEHNLDVIKIADYIIDLGPEGGDEGGTVVATGTPEDIALNPNSYTGHFLKQILNI